MNRFNGTAVRKTITISLIVILFTGTIISFHQSSSSSFIANVQAQPTDNLLEDVNCDNINLNGNNIDIDALPQSLGGLAGLIQSEAGNDGISNEEQRAINDFIFKCINNNENEFSQSQIPQPEQGATLSINKDWFVCNNDDIDCIIEPQEGEQTSFEGPNSGFYTQCTSDGQCPFANDAGFNIEITGNSPTPNTIPAQVNTMQQVEIGAGPFEVSEELFSNRFVPNAIFDVQNVPIGQNIFSFFPPTFIMAFDQEGQRLFTANLNSGSVSIIDLTDPDPTTAVTNIPLGAGGNNPRAIAFDQEGQRLFTANAGSNSVSIIDLTDPDPTTAVTNIPLGAGGDFPIAIAFDQEGQRLFTANINSDSVSIIDLTDPDPTTAVTNIPLGAGGDFPRTIAFDQEGQRLFTANIDSDSVSIINFPTVAKVCQDSGFETGDIRTFVSDQQTLQQISCVNFVGECSGNIENGETRECTVEDYVISLDEVLTNGESDIVMNMNKPIEQQQLSTNDISNTQNKLKTSLLPTGPFIYEVPKH